MNKLIILMLLFLSSCGGTYNIVVSGKVSVVLDISQITHYFEVACRNQLGAGASQESIDSCVANKVDSFIQTIHDISVTP